MPIGEAYQHKATSLTVISSIDTIENRNDILNVLHVSVSRKSRLPSWEDLKRAKNTFMGLDVDAYHVIPKADDHVNLHNYCMHLWAEWTHPNDDHRRHLCPRCSAGEAAQKEEDHAS